MNVHYGSCYLICSFIVVSDVLAKSWFKTLQCFLANSIYRPKEQKTDNSWLTAFDGNSHYSHGPNGKGKDFLFLWAIFIEENILK